MAPPRWRRRSLLRAGIVAVVTIITAPARAATPPAPAKVSQAEAGYQPTPRDGLSCAVCTLFRPPDACIVVAGSVSSHGWCKFFAMPD